jgi:plasmid stability protein
MKNDPAIKTTVIRLPSSLYTAIQTRSKAHLRSVNNEMIVLLKLGLVSEMGEAEALSAADVLISQTESDQDKENPL